MKIILKRLVYPVVIVLWITSCTSRANITIPAYQQFVLGEYEKGGFSVELNNTSPYEVKVETRNSENQRTSGFGLDANGKTKVSVGKGEKAVLINPNAENIIVKAKLTEGVEGMRYEVMDMAKMKKTQTLKETDLTPLLSNNWKGELTYVDYGNGQKVSIPCHLKIEKLKENTFKIYYQYPEEPKANSESKMKITDGGKKLEGRDIIKAEKDGDFFIIKAVEKGKDNNK